jgi:hypothetical protein
MKNLSLKDTLESWAILSVLQFVSMQAQREAEANKKEESSECQRQIHYIQKNKIFAVHGIFCLFFHHMNLNSAVLCWKGSLEGSKNSNFYLIQYFGKQERKNVFEFVFFRFYSDIYWKIGFLIDKDKGLM